MGENILICKNPKISPLPIWHPRFFLGKRGGRATFIPTNCKWPTFQKELKKGGKQITENLMKEPAGGGEGDGCRSRDVSGGR